MAFVLGISGSPSVSSRTAAVIDYAQVMLRNSGYETERVSVLDFDAEDVLHANFQSSAVAHFLSLVERADGVIIATPVYKAAYSGALKTLLDLLPQTALSGKVVWPIATGGTIAHLLAIDYALKPVLSALGARYVIGGSYLLDTQIERSTSGAAEIQEDAQRRLNQALCDFDEGIYQTIAYAKHPKVTSWIEDKQLPSVAQGE